MPCEACNIQFTVFKRKKSCTECRRLYCSNCLTKNKERILCKRCIIFTTRPLSKIELLKLKAKDLIFYLQSKHISTTGCVEKEELVNLVLIHVDNPSSFSADSQPSQAYTMGTDQSDDGRSNPFDHIRSTCQNLFTTFTDRISTDFNFDFKSNASDVERPSNVCENQPRHSDNFRQINPFGSNGAAHNPANNGNRNHQRPTTMTSSLHRPSEAGSPDLDDFVVTSPVIGTGTRSSSDSSSTSSPSCNQSSSRSMANDSQNPTTSNGSGSKGCQPGSSAVKSKARKKPTCAQVAELSKGQSMCCADAASGCECSDDELISKFREEYFDQGSASTADRTHNKPEANNTASVSESLNSLTKTGAGPETSPKEEIVESSELSSFEDLGAVGGGRSAGRTQTTATANETDRWQMIDGHQSFDTLHPAAAVPEPNASHALSEQNVGGGQPGADRFTETFRSHSNGQRNADLKAKLERSLRFRKKIARRQSDGVVYMASTSHSEGRAAGRAKCAGDRKTGDDGADGDNDDDDDDDDNDDHLDGETETSNSDESSWRHAQRTSCHKCGKTKGDLKRYIARFRHQLETTTDFSEAEIKRQLNAFLEFLENHSRNSFDSKDDEAGMDYDDSIDPAMHDPRLAFDGIEVDDFDDDYDHGIHVYGTDDDTANTTSQPPRQFFDLSSIERKEDLDELSVKQLKEILMLNRIDFKGCCEKSELLERVKRLWDDLQSCPAVDKLPPVDLCKICMDAAIECVLLECGHMATCTNCGKVLSECPICRQYIVRVVRFFKA